MESIIEPKKEKVYTSGQIFASGFFGGPFALIYTVGSNFSAFGNKKLGKYVTILGTIIVAILIGYLFATSNPNVYSSAGKLVQYATMMISAFFMVNEYKSKITGFLVNGGEKHSFWDVAKVVLFGIVMIFGIIMGITFLA